MNRIRIVRTHNRRRAGDPPIYSATPEPLSFRQLLNFCLSPCFFALLIPFLPASAQVAESTQNDLAGQWPRLSDGAQVSLITYTPGEELYQAFGHSAIRVRDDLLGMDRLYNYGVFDFETPNFYVKFVHGDLRYQLAVSSSEEEIRAVGAYGQGVTELPLNLSPSQRQALFEALEINLLPENRFYRYDFILDNCSTRPRDIIERITGSPVTVRDAGKQTFRDMLDPYFTRIPWAGLGVSLLMGARIDRPASPREACFLPADLERAVETSKNGEPKSGCGKESHFSSGGIGWILAFPGSDLGLFMASEFYGSFSGCCAEKRTPHGPQRCF